MEITSLEQVLAIRSEFIERENLRFSSRRSYFVFIRVCANEQLLGELKKLPFFILIKDESCSCNPRFEATVKLFLTDTHEEYLLYRIRDSWRKLPKPYCPVPQYILSTIGRTLEFRLAPRREGTSFEFAMPSYSGLGGGGGATPAQLAAVGLGHLINWQRQDEWQGVYD